MARCEPKIAAMALSKPSEPQAASAQGFALFALGFRPLYLLAGAYAALSVPLWAAQYAGWLPGANPLWHAHEVLFGYAFAVIAGFLLTAVRAWTSRPTPSGAALAGIAALWIAARFSAPYSLQVSSLLANCLNVEAPGARSQCSGGEGCP